MKKKGKIFFSKKRGFTLLEVLIAIFIFSLIMISASAFLSKSILTYRNVRYVQKDLEDAQYVMNQMAKTLRTSTIISPISESSPTEITIYDYSKDEYACIQYAFVSNKIRTRAANISLYDCINNQSFLEYSDLSNVYVTNAHFYVSPSCNNSDYDRDPPCTTVSPTGKILGKVTISMEICPDSYCTDKARIQTSVSLRDYGAAGL